MNVGKAMKMPKNLLFALDIGTRSVVGILAKREGDQTVVVDYECAAHPERAMLDGQIHDIGKVTGVVRRVVDALESRNGFVIDQAAIAAAGRALQTERATFELQIDLTREIDKLVTDSAEMQAVQLAQKSLAEGNAEASTHYCVGYSVITYTLDGHMILNPIGHRGSVLTVEVIATFLPHIVVDSLYTVLNRADLEVMNLTLEPIAAINIAIPKNLRLLNLALVDVGAGTSDIAIASDGAVFSYGMVPLAGDELTEKLAQAYLLDFNGAELLKTALCNGESHTYTDVLGLSHDVTTEEAMSHLNADIEHITAEIALQIKTLNKKAPSAVFCIGGGAQIPTFTEKLAEALEIPESRVAIKDVGRLEHIVFEGKPLKGPEFVTPIGIGVTAFEERDQDFIQVTVNDTSVRLFNSKPLQVADALILTGYNGRSLISQRGESFWVTVDDVQREIKGGYGTAAQILVNGSAGQLDTAIGHKDHILVVPAERGKQRTIQLKELIPQGESIVVGDSKIPLVAYVAVNGINRTGEYVLRPDDVVTTKGLKTVAHLAERLELDLEEADIICEGQLLEGDAALVPGKVYTYRQHYAGGLTRDDLLKAPTAYPTAADTGYIEVYVNNERVRIPYKGSELIFVDIFKYIDFDINEPKGILELILNDRRARYTDPIKAGDIIQLNWRNA